METEIEKLVVRKSGVYCILCKPTGKKYVGSAVNVPVRAREHRRLLRLNRHQNQYLQRAWNKYGEKAFRFLAITYCVPESCVATEQYWMDEWRTAESDFGFNISPRAGSQLGFKHSKYSKEKIYFSQR